MDNTKKIIKELKETKNLSQFEFADLLEINRTSLSKIENNKQE